jgi:hypothetical protein
VPALGVFSSGSLANRVERIVSRTSHDSPNWSRKSLPVSVLLLAGVSLAVGSLRIVEAVVVVPELDTAADAQPRQAQAENESARTNVDAALPAIVSQRPRTASTSRPVTTVRQSLPDGPTRADIPAGKAADDSPSNVVHTAPAAAILVEAHTSEREEPETAVESNSPQASPPSAPPQVTDAQRAVPWTAAADAGVALGQRSKEGGLATARFFSRFGKRIADSF